MDGYGIIIDDTKNTQSNSSPLAPGNGYGNYPGRTLVANNLCYGNGGSGTHSYSSEHVDIVHNVAYLNSQSPALDYGSIYASSSADCKILNNILFVKQGEPTNSAYNNTNVTYDYNIYYNGNTPAATGPNDVIANPLFVNPSLDPASANFRLQATSPGVDAGTAFAAVTTAFDGTARPQGAAVDRGAYETAAVACTVPNAPSSLVLTAVSSSQINLAWTDNSSNETDFQIERKLVIAIASSFSLIEKMAIHLQDPFENKPTDTPVTSIAATIERDLRQILKESQVAAETKRLESADKSKSVFYIL